MQRLLVAVLFLLLLSPAAAAEIMILAHGYLGDGDSWRSSGITGELTRRGWKNGGRLAADAAPSVGPGSDPGRVFFTVDLPSTAPLGLQADLLGARINQAASLYPGTPVTLVGHSAGGVVARLALVRFGAGPVASLVTIASPHLGTPRALQGLGVIQDSGPFEFLKEMVGGKTYRRVKGSGAALWDLAPPMPGNLLYWLNGQEHPDIRYVSVIRVPGPDSGDEIVPVQSQDLNRVPVLRGLAETVPTGGDHGLQRADGPLLHGLATTTAAVRQRR